MIELFNFFEKENNKSIQLIYLNHNEDEPLMLTNDIVRFRQIMINLLNNAFKYTEEGKIEFGYEKFRSKILFFVSDSGIGIRKDEQTKIFDHFFKIEQNKMKLYGGTGIGLTICKHLVKQMGGKIWVKSTINKGSTFYFHLPLWKDSSNLESY
jgi:signal transduction histidine kinase